MSEDTTSNTDVQLDFDDLDAFSSSFFGKEQAIPPAKQEAENDNPPDDAQNPEVDDTEGDDTPPQSSDEDETDDEAEEGQEAEPQKKPSRFQERINELTNARREAERREAALIARLDALENSKAPEPTPKPSQADDKSPTPNDLNEDGTDKYPLGEFDPGFIRDLTKFSVAEAQAEARAEQERRTAEQTQSQQAEALKASWETNQDSARSRYSDYSEKVASLEPVFAGIDPRLGDYFASTVMSMDKGPEVLYYLANHPDEARTIMNQGAAKATIHLGRLEARFVDEDKPQTPARVSKAPEPPAVNKGSAGGRRVIPDDTDDLDAFSAKFFSKKR